MSLLLIVTVFAACAHSPRSIEAVATDAVPMLAEDEGLLLVHVDTDVALESIRASGRTVVGPLAKGRYSWLVRMPVGPHAWDRVAFAPISISNDAQRLCRRPRTVALNPLRDLRGVEPAEFEFLIEPGRINYAGELILRAGHNYCGQIAWANIRNRNHAAMALRSLLTTHEAAATALPVRYAGSKPDSFLEHFERERRRLGRTGVEAAAGRTVGADGIADGRPAASGIRALAGASVVGLSAEVLFPYSGFGSAIVSPSGEWIAAIWHRGEHYGVLVQRVGLRRVAMIERSAGLPRIAWEGPATLIVQSEPRRGARRVRLARLAVENDVIQHELASLPSKGWLVDARPLAPGEVIWEFETATRNSVHRLTLDELLALGRGGIPVVGRTVVAGERLAVIDGSARRWLVDRDGTVRAAWRRDEEGYSILAPIGRRGRFEPIHSYLDDDPHQEIVPVGLSEDGERLLVTARDGGDFLALHEFDPGEGRLGLAIYRREDADVTGLLTDALTREPIGVTYQLAGEQRVHYFEAYQQRFLEKLDATWDRRSILVVSSSADRQSFVFLKADATNPGDYVFRDPQGHHVVIAREAEEVDRESLSPIESHRVRSKDGLEIEAFLSVPVPVRTRGAAPLVVMPHGGPIGVHDVREFDPIVQYLSSWGFAVLQVNYRGSSGYGLEFIEKGRRQWAKGIEDDIDAAVEWAMGRSEIDGRRIGIIGGSYGGFSALTSILRHRERYRCAVSINGVTDVPLLGHSSDLADSKKAMAFFDEFVGDFETEREKLIEISPAYRMNEVETPILIVQGSADRRVDPDHAHRLMTMLALYGKPHEAMIVAGGDHAFDRSQWISVVRRVRRFLGAHLQPGSPFQSDPESPHEAQQAEQGGIGLRPDFSK